MFPLLKTIGQNAIKLYIAIVMKAHSMIRVAHRTPNFQQSEDIVLAVAERPVRYHLLEEKSMRPIGLWVTEGEGDCFSFAY